MMLFPPAYMGMPEHAMKMHIRYGVVRCCVTVPRTYLAAVTLARSRAPCDDGGSRALFAAVAALEALNAPDALDVLVLAALAL